MNQFGSEDRMKLALDVDSLDEIAGRIRALLETKSPEGLMGKLKLLPMLADIGKFFPKTVSAARARSRTGSPDAATGSTCLNFRCCSAGQWTAAGISRCRW